MNVSVIIPVFRAEKFLTKAVNSALFHDEVKEIILIEDDSPDDCLSICQHLTSKYNRVMYYQHPDKKNHGAGASRNLGITKATQEYLCFLDADDYMTEIRFKKEKSMFSEIAEADGIYGAGTVVYDDSIGQKAWKKKGRTEYHLDAVTSIIPPNHLFDYLIAYKHNEKYRGIFTLNNLTIKRESLIKYNILFDERLRLHQDTLFIWQCAYFLKLFTGEFRDALSVRRISENNRYIFHQNLNESRSKMYKFSYQWAYYAKCKKEYLDVFASCYHYYHKESNLYSQVIKTWRYFIKYPYFRKKYIYELVIKFIPTTTVFYYSSTIKLMFGINTKTNEAIIQNY